jgi:hypothetical protein
VITLQVAGKFYSVEFRHVTRLGKRHELGDKSPIKAITTCVVAASGLIAIESAVCSDGDNFSRQRGRDLALDKVLARCSSLRAVRMSFVDAYVKATGVLLPRKAPHKTRKLSADEHQRCVDDGKEVRAARLRSRTLAKSLLDEMKSRPVHATNPSHDD